MARFGALLFGGGAIVTLLGLILPHESAVDAAELSTVGAGAALAALLLRLYGERLPKSAFWVVAASGTIFVSLALVFNGERNGGPAGGDEMYYLWVALYSAYFFGPLVTAGQVVFIAAAHAVALTEIDPGSIAVSRWLSTTGLVVGAALVVRLLSGRVERLVADLERTARTDSLTGLANRLAFKEQFDREVMRSHRTKQPFALLLADLDRFKEVNDRWGHVAGDAALAELGRLLPAALRSIDVAARVGGDEFAVLLPETDADSAREVGDRIARSVSAHALVGGLPVSLSFGVSSFDRDGRTLDDLTRAADEALYVAKRHTRIAAASTVEHAARRDMREGGEPAASPA